MPSAQDLLPYLDDYWRDQITSRYIDRYTFVLTSYPPNSPLTCRPDWRPATGFPGGGLDLIRRHVLDPFRLRYAICNVLHGAIALFHEDMSAALCAAVNDWTRERAARQGAAAARVDPGVGAKSRARGARDRAAVRRPRFVQVLFLAMGEMLLGRRLYWPIYAAAEKHGLTIGIHAGGTYRYAPTGSGWPGHKVEDYIAQSAAFEGQLLSLRRRRRLPAISKIDLCVGRVRLHLAAHLDAGARARPGAARAKCPGSISRPPRSFVNGCDSPCTRSMRPRTIRTWLVRTLTHIGSDRCVVFDRLSALAFRRRRCPAGRAAGGTPQKIMIDNPLATYPRLQDEGAMSDNARQDSGERDETFPSVKRSRRSGFPWWIAISTRPSANLRSCIRSCRNAGASTYHIWRAFASRPVGQLPYRRMTAGGMRVNSFPSKGRRVRISACCNASISIRTVSKSEC